MANYDLTYEGSEVQKILDTGDELQTAGYIFRGEATPSTVPGTPTERVAYIGGPGTYTNFGGSITVGAGCICVFKYTGSAWSNQVINTGLDSAVNTLQSAITAINNNIGNGYVYAGVATPSTSPVTGKVFYLAVQAGTYTNFGSAVVTAGLNVLKYNGSAWSVDQVIAIDAEPTQGSDHLVKSGGVLNSIIQNGPAFDLSAYNAQGGVLATYADLSAALTALNALPADFKKGGMSMKFVLTSDNKYVQFRCMAQNFTTDATQWQTSTSEIKAGSKDLAESGGVDAYVKAVAENAGLPFVSLPNNTEASANASISSNGSLTITGGTAGVKLQTSHRYIVVRKYIELGYNNVYMLNTGGYSYVLQIEISIYHAVGDVVVNDITVPSGTNEVLTIRRGGTSDVPQTVCKVLVLDVTNLNEDEINNLKNYQYSDTDFASNGINLITTVDDKIEESIVDNLESENVQKSLSAKQGKVLNSKINSIIGNPFNITLNNIATASASATIGSDGALTISALGAGVVAEIGHRYLLVVEYTAGIYGSIYVLNSAGTSIAYEIESGVYHASNTITVYDMQMISGYKNQISLRRAGDSNVPQSYWKVMLFDVTTLSEANITKLKKANLYSDDMFGDDAIDFDYSSSFVRETLYGVFDGLLVNCLGDSLSQGTAEEGYVGGFKYMYDAIDRLAIAVGGSAVGGSRVSGGGNAFNTDTRINALNINSKAIVIFGGTNDSGSYTMGDFTQENYDVSTFVGAYNVLISKIYYKYLKLSAGYYQSVDYSGITQVENPLNYIPIILVAPPQSGNPAFYNQIKPIAEAVEKIGEMWGLPVISALKEAQYNPMISNSPDVHVAINYFDYIGGLITEKLISMIRVFKKQIYKTNSKTITVSNTSGFVDNIPQTAYAGDIVSFMIETSTSPTITATAGGNTVSISDLGLYGSPRYHYYQFTMPNNDVTISIS